MKILGLPGIKPATLDWMQSLLKSLDQGQNEILIQQYHTWHHPGSTFDLEQEANIAGKFTPDLVIAKSIGTRVALSGYNKSLLHAHHWILIGLPIHGYNDNEIHILQNLVDAAGVLIIQQTADPAGSYSELCKIITAPLDNLVEVPGNDHWYGDIASLKLIIENWFGRNTT